MDDVDLIEFSQSRSLSEEIYGRPPELKIFVSSKMRGGLLTVERARAAAAVETIPQLAKAWYWERDANAGPYCSEEVCLGHVATCDGLILILADELTLVTRREFELAYSRGVPIYMFLDQRAQPDQPTAEFIAEQQRHARKITTRGFQNVSELESHTLKAVIEYTVRAVRTVNFQRGTQRADAGGAP